MAVVALLSACRSVPVAEVPIAPTSSLLAVDVQFPIPFGRDPSLVQVWFLKDPIGDGSDRLPELVPATFVKWSRAYLLDPEPGAYSVAAVAAEYAPPWNVEPIAGVSDTVWSGTSSDAMIFPTDLIGRTTTSVAPGGVAFMGALRVRPGDHINASAVPEDDLQRRIAERIRPGVTSESGISGWLKRTRTVDLENTSLGDGPADREAFLLAAGEDLGASPWAGVVTRESATAAKLLVRPRPPVPRRERPVQAAIENAAEIPAQSPAPNPEAAASKPRAAVAVPQPQVAAPQPAVVASPSAIAETPPAVMELRPGVPEPRAAAAAPAVAAAAEPTAVVATAEPPEPEPVPIAPKPKRPPGIPPDSPLAKIELGMDHEEVLRILGDPDGRVDRVTAKAWIPFYNGPGAHLRDFIYAGKGRVVFSHYKARLTVIDVVYEPGREK